MSLTPLGLTDADRAALQAELAALEQARLGLLTGRSRVSVQYDNRKVEYSPANLTALLQRIAEVKALLGITSRRSIGVSFGRR